MTTIGVIGGSGLYDSGNIQIDEWITIETPWGLPSDRIAKATIGATTVLFIPRHAEGHKLHPSRVPYRANIAALKHLGANAVLSLSAVGSLREEYAPGDIVMPDQFIDRTRHRVDTFFDDEIVAHVSLADPFCKALQNKVAELVPVGVKLHRGGTYIAMEGPQFSTRAESHWYRAMGGAIIGMTNLTEARLAREAELAYVSLSFVTDYDCWREGDEVSVEDILKVLHDNSEVGKQIIANLGAIEQVPASIAHSALQFAIITAQSHWTTATVQKLQYIKPGLGC